MNRNVSKRTENHNEEISEDNTSSERIKNNKKIRSKLPEKEFEIRRSLLIELIEDNVHFSGAYNILLSFTVLHMTVINFTEYVHHGRLSPALQLILNNFGQFQMTFIIWLGINIGSFLCYYFFVFWTKMRQKVPFTKFFDILCMILLVKYFGFLLYIIPVLINLLDVPFASSMIILGESVRFLMKIYAFARDNTAKVLKQKSDEKDNKLPTFSHFVYFVYAPTAVYKDQYPRQISSSFFNSSLTFPFCPVPNQSQTTNVRWNFVVARLAEILWTILCQAHVYTYMIVPMYEDTCKQPVTLIEFFILLLKTCIPSTVLLWLTFISTIHSTQNAVGEILRFGDRMFYSDWWNVQNLQQYYKKWNWVVGDFLYIYINKDLNDNVCPDKRFFAKLTTILISAVLHDWVASIALGFYSPVTSIVMILSICMLSNGKPKDNKFYKFITWVCVPIGISLIATMMFTEHFARLNLPSNTNGTFQYWKHCIVYKS
ncbi:unnamed protein product [Phyllotreta striolata]|uniref:O-acyltransferase n=1 Tax=Phyllotreta striolata TaxID=444603 RepID=A0A9N9TWN4_PHYSR|nr:unnamed protein product [Phyllotreta striolata]